VIVVEQEGDPVIPRDTIRTIPPDIPRKMVP
jgi:hypothetical protein